MSEPSSEENCETGSIVQESSNDSDDSMENINIAEFFSEVLKNLDDSKNQYLKYKNNTLIPSTSKAVNSINYKSNDLSKEISELLLQGEQYNNIKDKKKKNEPENDTNYIIPQKGIQIHLSKEKFMFNNKNQKQKDLQKILKDKFNQRVRNSQIYIHKVGLLCWLSHGFFLNKLINDPEILKIALSIISSNNYPKNQIDLKYIKKFTIWFTDMFVMCDMYKQVIYSKDLLIQRFKEKNIYNYKEIILLYVSTLRGMGINCRLIISLQPPILKPRPEQLFKFVATKKQNKKIILEQEKTDAFINEKIGINSIHSNDSNIKKIKKIVQKSEGKINDKNVIPENSYKAIKIKNLENKKQAVINLKRKIPDNLLMKDEIKTIKKRNLENTNSDSNYNNAYENVKVENNLSIAKKLYLKTSKSKKEDNMETMFFNKEIKNKSKTNVCFLKEKCKSFSNTKFYEEANISSIHNDYKDKKLNKEIPINTYKNQIIASKNIRRRKLLSSDEDNNIINNVHNIWVEVYIESEESWISIDILDKKINCVNEIYKKAGNQVSYIVAWNSTGLLKDVTRRYCPHWLTNTRKKRVNEKWWSETLSNWQERKSVISKAEDEQLLLRELKQPLPKTLTECKGHPLYVLERHLLKFEALYPSDVIPLGYLKTGEAIYSRHCVHTLFSRETWIKKARVVKPLQKAYKIVKSMPKYDKLSGVKIKDQPLELFGKWQTTPYIPPEAKDGTVPRNEYGNVDLFKKCMLPKGTVYINLPALNRIARKLKIDCAPACVGFNFGCRGALPTFEGFIVCKEYEDILRDAWKQDQIETEKRVKIKREKKIYENWKKLIKGLLIRERLALKYNFKGKDN